jgi:hypothetical protein
MAGTSCLCNSSMLLSNLSKQSRSLRISTAVLQAELMWHNVSYLSESIGLGLGLVLGLRLGEWYVLEYVEPNPNPNPTLTLTDWIIPFQSEIICQQGET